MNLSGVMTQLIALFLMMAVGYAVAKTGLITPDFRKKLSSLVLMTAAPGSILSAALQSNIAGREMLVVLLVAAAFYVILSLLAKVMVVPMRSRPSQAKVDQLMLIFTNVGFMGIPVVE